MNKPECVWRAPALLGEGPHWSQRQQSLYWVDILGRRLHRYSAQGDPCTWEFEQEISAVVECAHGDGLLVSLRHGLALFEPESCQLKPLIQLERNLASNRLNDGKCDAHGRFWAGSMDFDGAAPNGSLYRIAPNLEWARIDTGYPVTNGPAWSADNRTMYFNDSANGRVYAFDFDPETGAVSDKRLFLQLGGAEGSPDGMATDAEGGLWIAQWGAGKVTRRDAQGQVIQTITLPCSQVSSCTFGGSDLKTLYITTASVNLSAQQLEQEPLAGCLFAIGLDIAGLPANLFRG